VVRSTSAGTREQQQHISNELRLASGSAVGQRQEERWKQQNSKMINQQYARVESRLKSTCSINTVLRYI
jgi:hypothetical protein